MIDANGRPITKAALKGHLATYNAGVRGSREFMALPRALVIVLDNLAVGKTTYLKCQDGQVQVSRGKDRLIASSL
ncbi:hypothetical protein [Arenibaculum pallidiluteum]|uniref:hypothetical protein n=1 Tax=Arenibaculum pallidiluteum TaxID=2812559 RepID=UPI001A95C5AD|nr:hypothetical protein [Arenibaculum pallidiluteum]